MNVPCKNCLVLAMCKGRINDYSQYQNFGWTILYDRCSLFEDYYTVHYCGKVDLELKKIFGKHYRIFKLI
jgi:hypothetical protein